MSRIRNNTPQVIFNGMKDESILPLVPELEEEPIHLPLHYVFTQRGPEVPVLCGPTGDFGRIYGSESLNSRSPYYSHQTKMLETITGEANSVLVKRLIPDDAQVGGMTLVCTVTRSIYTEDAGALYRRARNANGTFVVDQGRFMYVNGGADSTPIVATDGDITPTFDGGGAFEPASIPVDGTYEISGMAGHDRTIYAGGIFLNNGHIITVLTGNVTAMYKPFQTKTAMEDGTDLTTPEYIDNSVVYSWEWVAAAYANGVLVPSQSEIDYEINGAGVTAIETLTVPVMTVYAPSQGEYANNIGMRLWIDKDYDAEVVDDNKANVLVAQFLERAAPGKPAYVQETFQASSTVDFTFNPSAYNAGSDENLFVNNIVDYYNNSGILTGTSPTFGPAGEVVLHEIEFFDDGSQTAFTALAAEFTTRFTEEGITNNIEMLFMMAAESESDAITAEAGIGDFDKGTDAMLLDIFTGLSTSGVPYYGFKVGSFHNAGGAAEDDLDTAFDEVGGTDGTGFESYPDLEAPTLVPFDNVNTHYFGGGEDGTLTDLVMEEQLVYEIEQNYNNTNYDLTDTGRYPFSAIYDSGYTADTKEVLFNWLAYRPDVHVCVGTHVQGEKLSIAEDEARSAALITAAQQFAESEEWGTKAVRAVILAHSSVLIRGSYRKRLPLTFELAKKRARYLGAGNGVIKYGLDYTTMPRNALEIMNPEEVNNVFMSHPNREQLWTNGANFVQFADRKTVFFPALQTVYDPRNSVLTSELIMQIAVDVTKQCDKTWKLMSGDTSLTPGQFLERSNEQLLKLTAGKYGTRVVVTPNAYYTAADVARGYSWVMEAIIYGNVMKTTATVNVIIRRNFD